MDATERRVLDGLARQWIDLADVTVERPPVGHRLIVDVGAGLTDVVVDLLFRRTVVSDPAERKRHQTLQSVALIVLFASQHRAPRRLSTGAVCERTEHSLVRNETRTGNGTVVGHHRSVSVEAPGILGPFHDFPGTRAIAADVDYRTAHLLLLSLHDRAIGLDARVPARVHRARPVAGEEGDDVLVVDPHQSFVTALTELEERRVVAVVAKDEPVPELLPPTDHDVVCISVRYLELVGFAGRDGVELVEAARLRLGRAGQSRNPRGCARLPRFL